LNAAAGGCAAGFIAGVRARSLPLAFGACAAMGTAIGTFSAAGNVCPSPSQPFTQLLNHHEVKIRVYADTQVADT
jgi:hypothetical protein